MRRFIALCCLPLLGGFMPVDLLLAASPPGLERLFTTAGQRQELDRMRRDGVLAGQRMEPAAVGAAITESRVSIDGIVVGSDGRKIVWVNGRAMPAESVLDGRGVRVRLVSDERVAVKPAGQRRSALLKPGQVLELGSGRIHESYETIISGQTPGRESGHAR